MEQAVFSCLATRFPYGEPITGKKLRRVEMAEQFLFEMGFTQFRVRSHDRMARIEIRPQEFSLLVEKERSWPRGLKNWGLCI